MSFKDACGLLYFWFMHAFGLGGRLVFAVCALLFCLLVLWPYVRIVRTPRAAWVKIVMVLPVLTAFLEAAGIVIGTVMRIYLALLLKMDVPVALDVLALLLVVDLALLYGVAFLVGRSRSPISRP